MLGYLIPFLVVGVNSLDINGSLSNRVDETIGFIIYRGDGENPLILFNSIQKGFITYIESI